MEKPTLREPFAFASFPRVVSPYVRAGMNLGVLRSPREIRKSRSRLNASMNIWWS